MAPKEPFKVHSLNKHIENTKKGLSAEAQFNRRPGNRVATIKKESSDPNKLFANNDDDDDDNSGSGSDSDSSSDSPVDFIAKLTSTTKPASATPRRRSKNDEIADSDDERNASKKSTSVKKSVPANSKPQTSSDSSSEDESDDENPKAKTNGITLSKTSDSTSSSSESESDSDSDDEDDKAPTDKPSTQKQDASDSTSDSSSDEESEDDADVKTKAKPAVNGTAVTTSDSSSEGSESESEDEERAAKPAAKPAAPESHSSSSEEDSDDEMVDESMHIEDREGQLTLPNFIAPDFVLRKGDDGTNGRDVAEICNKANLEGKQFWYFTVPSNVPISVVQNLEIPMNQSHSTDKLFSHNGEDYGVSFESIAPKGNIQIMIPSDRPQYQPTTKQIDQVMQVKKITQLGSTNSVVPVAKPAPRAQPAGLKARYQPIGVNEPMGSIGNDEDVEMGEAPILPTKTMKKEKKHKSKETSDKKQKKGQSIPEPPSSRTTEAPTPDARKNKRKLAASEDDAIAVAEQLQEEAKSAASKSKKQRTDRAGSPDLGSEPASAVAKKHTPVLPPTIPTTGTPTPKSASTPVASSKKQKKVKEASIPAPRQSVVPIPSIPHSSPPRSSPARAPASQPPTSPSRGKEKRAKKRKEKDSKTSSAKKETPVLPPMPPSSSE
ncbi:hypothetical protein IL306_008647 [Fusarium sp. DS 682]|nr:hypothetical protein IL306_008647 [Fusarium sp. DS 682]